MRSRRIVGTIAKQRSAARGGSDRRGLYSNEDGMRVGRAGPKPNKEGRMIKARRESNGRRVADGRWDQVD